MAEVNLDVAMESTSQEILGKSHEISLKVDGLISAGEELTCTASDNVLLSPVTSEMVAPSGNSVTCCQYKCNKISGSLRLVASLRNVYSGNVAKVFLYKNDSVALTLTSTNDGTYVTRTGDFTITSGDVIKVAFRGDLVSDGAVNLITICGDLSEPSTDVPGFSAIK